MDKVSFFKQNFELRKENTFLKKELKKSNNALSFANNKIKQLENKIENDRKGEEERIEKAVNKAVKENTEKLKKEYEKQINELKGQISRLEKRLNTNSSNSGIPTSKDRIGIHKIQNNREKTERKIGSQKAHKIHKLNYFTDEEITQTVEHTLEKCPNCGGKLEEENIVKSDIIDLKIEVTKTRNNIHNYKCTCCKKKVSANKYLPRGVTYGDNINAIGLSLMNEANTPLNKITAFLNGISNGMINLCEGYLVKIQKRATDGLDGFINDLKEKVISLKHVFWDDTTVKFGIGKPEEGYDEKDIKYFEDIKDDEKKKDKKVRQGIIRFYGDDDWAYLVGHRFKNAEGIDADGILENLKEDCVVMHDHVLLNYSDKYHFQNAECNEHAKRYLNGVTDMFPEHKWANQMRNFLTNLNNEKEALIESGINCFSVDKIKQIFDEYDRIIQLGYKENGKVDLTYILNKNEELNLIERLDQYRENHLMFATNFSVDFTNNTSELALRQVKRKIAVSFMFKNANRMKDYATVLSYLETCYRHGISRFEASKRLVCGNPFTVEELSNLPLLAN